MKQYIQYDDNGNITATVVGDKPPSHPRQIEAAPQTEIVGKKVHVASKALVDAPPPVYADGTLEKFIQDWPYDRLIDALADSRTREPVYTAAAAVKAGIPT